MHVHSIFALLREIASIMAKAHREGTPLTFLDPTGLAKCAAWGLLDREQGKPPGHSYSVS